MNRTGKVDQVRANIEGHEKEIGSCQHDLAGRFAKYGLIPEFVAAFRLWLRWIILMKRY